jgi:hypothetical protein
MAKMYWLYEFKHGKRKGSMAYVRPAVGEFENIFPIPACHWQRILPPPKLIEFSEYERVKRQLDKALEMLSELDQYAIHGRTCSYGVGGASCNCGYSKLQEDISNIEDVK